MSEPKGFQRTGDIARDSLIGAIEQDLDDWFDKDDPYASDDIYTDYRPSEVSCETCGVWLGYNYPAPWCRECKPEGFPHHSPSRDDQPSTQRTP